MKKRTNGYPRDVLAPDGIPEYGWRLVRKGGKVKIAKDYFQHDKLIPFIGKYIAFCVNDYWLQEIRFFTDYPTMEGKIICIWKYNKERNDI